MGAEVNIIDYGTKEAFNNVSPEYQWVKVQLLSVPKKKYEGGMKSVFERNMGWVMAKYLDTTKETKDIFNRLPAAPGAFNGISPYAAAFEDTFPAYEFSLGGHQIQAPPYHLTPWCRKINGKTHVVAYSAMDHGLMRNEYVIGPEQLDFFIANKHIFVDMRPENMAGFVSLGDLQAHWAEQAAYAEWVLQQENHWMRHSQKAMEAAAKGDWDGYWHWLGEAWVGKGGALKSADWWVATAGGVLARRPASAPNSIFSHITSKISNQLAKRGWTKQLVHNVVNNPFTKRNAINKANGNKAIAYFTKDGAYVVKDEVTGEIIQVSNRLDPHWIPDPTIVNPYIP